MNELAVFGAGGHAREVIALVRDLNAVGPAWSLAGVLTDRPEWTLPDRVGLPRLGGIDWLAARPACHVVVAVGNPASRREIVQRIGAAVANPFATLVHPRAWIAERVSIGAGAQIFAGTLVNTDAHIGAHVILNVGCRVSHDSVIGGCATLGPGATLCGGVTVGAGCELGAGSVVLPRITIGEHARLGAGAVATRSIPEGATAVGIPARVRASTPPAATQR
jgi:sugar O-acyltransferase (sialic acid O-acetyltransferase NeuD family)